MIIPSGLRIDLAVPCISPPLCYVVAWDEACPPRRSQLFDAMKNFLFSALLLPSLVIAQQDRKTAMNTKIDQLGIRETPALRGYTLSEFMDYVNAVFRRNGITGIHLTHSPHRVDPYTGKPLSDPNAPITGGPAGIGVPAVPIDPITGLPLQFPAPQQPLLPPPPTTQTPADPKFFSPENVNIVGLNYPLRGLTLRQVIDQVCRNCDIPTRFRVTAIGIEFYETTPADRATETRRFRSRGLR